MTEEWLTLIDLRGDWSGHGDCAQTICDCSFSSKSYFPPFCDLCGQRVKGNTSTAASVLMCNTWWSGVSPMSTRLLINTQINASDTKCPRTEPGATNPFNVHLGSVPCENPADWNAISVTSANRMTNVLCYVHPFLGEKSRQLKLCLTHDLKALYQTEWWND